MHAHLENNNMIVLVGLSVLPELVWAECCCCLVRIQDPVQPAWFLKLRSFSSYLHLVIHVQHKLWPQLTFHPSICPSSTVYRFSFEPLECVKEPDCPENQDSNQEPSLCEYNHSSMKRAVCPLCRLMRWKVSMWRSGSRMSTYHIWLLSRRPIEWIWIKGIFIDVIHSLRLILLISFFYWMSQNWWR